MDLLQVSANHENQGQPDVLGVHTAGPLSSLTQGVLNLCYNLAFMGTVHPSCPAEWWWS